MNSGNLSGASEATARLASSTMPEVSDNILLTLGTDNDGVLVLNTAGLAADALLTNVIEGTADTLGTAANSLLIANITNDGDIAILVSKAGNSHTAFWADGSTGDTALMAASGASADVYIAGTKVLDYATGAFAFQQAVTISSTSTLTLGAITLGGAVAGGAQALSNLGTVYIGDTANANVTLGLTINQGAADNIILAFKSSDIAHGRTAWMETDSYGSFQKSDANLGGLTIKGVGEDDVGLTTVLGIQASGGQASTTKSTSGRSLVEFFIEEHNGSNTIANVTANGNVLGIKAYTGNAVATLFIVDVDGDLWLNGGLTGTTLTMSGACDVGTSCEADAYTVGGAAGATGTFTSVTVANGIVTSGT